MRILHLASTGEWANALTTGRYTTSSRGVTLDEEGFIHASTATQAAGVLERYYADCAQDELVLLVLDIDALDAAGSPIRWDDVPGQPQPFPHIYGPIVPSAAAAVLPLDGTTGDLRLPDLTGLDVAP